MCKNKTQISQICNRTTCLKIKISKLKKPVVCKKIFGDFFQLLAFRTKLNEITLFTILKNVIENLIYIFEVKMFWKLLVSNLIKRNKYLKKIRVFNK